MGFKIGDTVVHVNYPAELGRVVAKMPRRGYILVRWPSGQCSRHAPCALREAFPKSKLRK